MSGPRSSGVAVGVRRRTDRRRRFGVHDGRGRGSRSCCRRRRRVLSAGGSASRWTPPALRITISRAGPAFPATSRSRAATIVSPVGKPQGGGDRQAELRAAGSVDEGVLAEAIERAGLLRPEAREGLAGAVVDPTTEIVDGVRRPRRASEASSGTVAGTPPRTGAGSSHTSCCCRRRAAARRSIADRAGPRAS